MKSHVALVVDFLRPRLPMLRLLAGSIGSLVIGIVAQAIGFVFLARYLGALQFGHMITITAVTALANTWCGLGPGEVLRRIVSREPSMYAEALGHTLLMIGLTGVGLTAVVIPAMMLFVPTGIGFVEYFQILLFFVPTNVLMPSYINMVENVFLARGDYRRANLVNAGSGIVRAVAAVVACGMFGVASLRGWAFWWAGVHALIGVSCLAAIWHFGRPRWRVLHNEVWLGGSLALSSFLIMLRHNVDVLVLSAVTSSEFVGVYGAGRRVIGAALVVPGAFDRVIYGKLAIAGKDGVPASLALARKYLVYSMIISAITSVSLFFVAPYVPLIFGSAYEASSDVIGVLSWTVISTAVQFLAFDALNAADHHRTSASVSGIANVVGAAMVVIFGGIYGTFGIYASLYLSDIIRGGGLWWALVVMSRRERAKSGDRPAVEQA